MADQNHMETTRRPRGATLSVLLVVAAAGASLVLDGDSRILLLGVAWILSGVTKWVSIQHRPEPPRTWAVLGVANVLLGLGWLLAAAGGTPGPLGVQPSLLVVVVGLALICVGTLTGVPGHRWRTAILDGQLASMAIAMAAATAWMAVYGVDVDSAMLLTGFLMVWAAFATPAVMGALLLSGLVRSSDRGPQAILSTAGLVIAALATATMGVAGQPLPGWVVALWLVTPVLSSAAVASRRTIYVGGDGDGRDAMTTPRVVTLTLLAVVPAGVGAVAGIEGLWVLALAGSLAACLMVIARIVVSVRYEIEHVRASADVRFDALLEHSAEVVALADADGFLFYVSRPVQRAFAIAPEALVGLPAESLVVGEYLEAWTETLRTARDRPGVPVEAQIQLADGRGIARHVEVTVVDLCDIEGVNAVSITVRDVTERVQLERELVRRVRLDDLTGLFNRHVLTERVTHVLERRDAPCALVYLDVNDFKLVNDSYGHAAGDVVLRAVADRISGVLRRADTAGRLGGDEFAILLEELKDPDRDIKIVTDRIHAACAEPILIAPGECVRVRVAVGVATPQPGMIAAELFSAADAAMYVAKREHRGTVRFEQSMSVSSESRMRLMQDVGSAIESGSFDMHYQPIVDLSTGRFTGAEALLRWNHPTLGRVLPHHFLDHAEAAGLTAELTHAIAAKIRVDMDRWDATTGGPLHVAMNLSAEQLTRVTAAQLLETLTPDGLARGQITIEVTETSMLGDLTGAAEILDDLRAAGCEVAIDDFGTGHASIGYLRTLPVDFLKIDREFVKDLVPADAVHSFAATIHRLARDLALQTVAEGIETAEQRDAAIAIGCRLGQGWLFGRPMPLDDLIATHGAAASMPDETDAFEVDAPEVARFV